MEPPLFPTGGSHVVRAAPGTVANLLLPVPFGSPPFHYKWNRAGASLDDRFVTSEDARGVRLTVSAARTGDSGVYTLQASNAVGKDTTRVRLEVSPDEAPVGDDPPNFLRRLQDLTVKVGTRTRFLVEIVSSTECKVTWYRNERRLMETERVALVRDGNFWCADVATVSVDDAGRWTCTAENTGGRASCSAHLNVLVPKAYKRPEFVEELRALLTEQGTVSLECKVVGVPTPILRWFKDSREIKAGDVFALTANAEDPTSLGTYTCEAVNCMGRAYSSSKVHVVGRASNEGSMRPSSGGVTPEPPPIFTKELEDQFVRICDPLTLSCHIVVPPWPRSVVWYNKDGKIEANERYHILEDGVGGYLVEVCSAEWADEGEWKCVASTAGGRVGMSACYVSMDVPKNYRKPRFMENLQAVLTEEGLVSFECKVVGFPTPVLSWFKDGQELKPGDVYQLTGTNSLGSYCCIARNCMGQASSSAELTVEDIQNQLNEEEKHQLFSKNQAPKFLLGLKSVEAKIDEPFRFTIKVAIPPEPSLLWYRDDQPVDESSRCHHGKEDRGTFYLDIQNLEFLDQAEWKCIAINDFGQSVTSCFLKLIIPRHYKKPRFLENLQAILSDEGAVNLECKVIGVPQPILKWYKDGEELKPGDIHRIISGQDGTCCLGTYTCEAQNCMGIAASSASLLGFDDSMKTKNKKKSEEQTLQRNLSLSTIHEERTSQMYDTPVGDRTLDDKGEISFSFDGKEVSVSLYETPDLTEEEALQIVEMYADQLSENVTEHNVVELPPLRFIKETSTSGNLLMEAIIIDVSPEYFASPEEDLRTEADIEDISIADENGLPQISLDQDQDITSHDYLEKTMALLSDEKADIPKKLGRKKSDSQKSVDDYFSLSRDQSLSEEKRDDDTQVISESDLQSFASAKSSAKLKSKSSRPSLDDPMIEIIDVKNNKLFKEDSQEISIEPEVPIPKHRRRSNKGSRRSSSGSEKSLGKLKDDKLVIVEQPVKKLIADDEYKTKINNIANSLTKVLNDIQIIERDIILQSELMSSVATASKSLEIIGSLINPLSEIQSVAEAAREAVSVSPEINSALFNSLPPPFKALFQSLTIMEKCVDVESENKTLVKKTCTSLMEKCGSEIHNIVDEIYTLISKKYLDVDEIIVSQIESLSNEMLSIIRFSMDTIKAKSLLHEASEFKPEVPSLDMQHTKDTQKAIFELKAPLRSLLRIIESTESDTLSATSKIKSSEIILNDMSVSIQDLQEGLEQIEFLSVKESNSSLNKYNTEIIESVMDSVLKLRTSFEQLSVEARKDGNENNLKQVLSAVKLNLNEISSLIEVFENKVGKFDILHSDNKLEILQRMAQTLISFENSLTALDIVADAQYHMIAFHKHLTKVLENVIESNDGAKYFAFMEICDTLSRLNSSIKSIESNDVFSLISMSNTLKIVQNQFIQNVFAPELNCLILSSIEDIQMKLLKSINTAEEVSLKADLDSIKKIQETNSEKVKTNIVIESIEQSIAVINQLTNEENANEFQISIMSILQNIQPNLEELKQNIASLSSTEIYQEEHISELSDISVKQTIASPICELNKNIMVLNQTIMENVESLKEVSGMDSTYAQPLRELLNTLEILQHEVISQYGEDVLPYAVSTNIANVVNNLHSCILLIQEHSVVETADEMSTLEDISGIKTTAEVLPSDNLVSLITEEVFTGQCTDKLEQQIPHSVTAQTLQALNENAIELQKPDIIEFLDSLSEINNYFCLKSVAVTIEKLNQGIQEILHPILMENVDELLDSLNTSILMQLADPLQVLNQSLSVVDTSNIPIYENILNMPSEKIHSAIEKLSNFKKQLDICLSYMPVQETTDKSIDVLSNLEILKQNCVELIKVIHESENGSVPMNTEVKYFKQTLISFVHAIDQEGHMDVAKVKEMTKELHGQMLLIQDELIQCTTQPSETITQEVKLIETVHQLEKNIAVLEQFQFIDSSRASDIEPCTSPQLADEIQVDSLTQIDDIVNHAVNVVQDVGHDTPTADLMILEDFFKTCKYEFSILRCLITKRPSYKKLIRLLQEFNFLKCIVSDLKNKRQELSLSEDINDILSNFMLNLDVSMNEIENSLLKIVHTQSKLLFEVPIEILNDNTKTLIYISKNYKNQRIVSFINKFLQFIMDMRPIFDNLKLAIAEELQSKMDSVSVEKQASDENVDLFLNYIEEESSHINNDDDYKYIVESVYDCLQKHQDCKDIIGQSKTLMLLKCLSECSSILKQILSNEKQETKQSITESEVIVLKSILSEMVEPLQGIRSQLMHVQEQISSGADEESISIDITSTEPYVQTLTEIHNDVLQILQSEKTVVDEADLSLIEELDKEIHIIQENIHSADGTGAENVTKQLATPLENIEKSLLLAKEKILTVNEIEIPKDINSNISSLEYFLNRFITLEIDLLDVSEFIPHIDLKKCLSLAIEISSIINPTQIAYQTNSANNIRIKKMTELKNMLMKFDWLSTDQCYENHDVVVIEKLKHVSLSAYQLLSELNNVIISLPGLGVNVSEENTDALLKHIDQYIEFIEIVEEVSAIIKMDDLLETANTARELRESFDTVTEGCEKGDAVIKIAPKQELLMQKLQKAVSELEMQPLDKILEMAPTLIDDKQKQHVMEVVSLLKADLRAITGIQIAVEALTDKEIKSIKSTILDESGTEHEIDIKKIENKTESETIFESEASGVELADTKLISKEISSKELEDTNSEAISESEHKILETSKDQDTNELMEHTVSEEIVNVNEELINVVGDVPVFSPEEQTNATLIQDLSTISLTVAQLIEHIDEFICDDVREVLSKLAAESEIENFGRSIDAAKEIRECIIALEVSPLESVKELQNKHNLMQGEFIFHLLEALSTLRVFSLHHAEELKTLIGDKSLDRVVEVVHELYADINAIMIIRAQALARDQEHNDEQRDVLETQDSGQFSHEHTITILEEEELSVTTGMFEDTLEEIKVNKQDDHSTISTLNEAKVLDNIKDSVKVEDTSEDRKIVFRQDAKIGTTADIETIDSMKRLEMLLMEVNDQIDSCSTHNSVEETEFLRNILDEVQTVIIKLKRDFDGSVNDALNETLEDLECSVRSVQLQIEENSAPDLLKDAIAALQLLVTNMSDVKVHVSHALTEQTTNVIIQQCCAGAEQTIKLLDEASKTEIDGQMISVVSKLNSLKETLKSLQPSFQGSADILINDGTEVTQKLDQMEEQIFSLEKDIDSSNCQTIVKDSLMLAVHAVYQNISNMRSTISSIQKEFMYENYGKPSERFLRSQKNIAIIIKSDDNISWESFKKVLRQVLNHFEDIKFYVNFDKTARIPSDAAFTKIILEELNKELKNVILPDSLKLYPEITEKVKETINNIEEYCLLLETRSSIEVKEKIPIFKDISEHVLIFTETLLKINHDNITKQKSLPVQSIKQQLFLSEIENDENISELLITDEQIKYMVSKENENTVSITQENVYYEDSNKDLIESQIRNIESNEEEKENNNERVSNMKEGYVERQTTEPTPSCSFEVDLPIAERSQISVQTETETGMCEKKIEDYSRHLSDNESEIIPYEEEAKEVQENQVLNKEEENLHYEEKKGTEREQLDDTITLQKENAGDEVLVIPEKESLTQEKKEISAVEKEIAEERDHESKEGAKVTGTAENIDSNLIKIDKQDLGEVDEQKIEKDEPVAIKLEEKHHLSMNLLDEETNLLQTDKEEKLCQETEQLKEEDEILKREKRFRQEKEEILQLEEVDMKVLGEEKNLQKETENRLYLEKNTADIEKKLMQEVEFLAKDKEENICLVRDQQQVTEIQLEQVHEGHRETGEKICVEKEQQADEAAEKIQFNVNERLQKQKEENLYMETVQQGVLKTRLEDEQRKKNETEQELYQEVQQQKAEIKRFDEETEETFSLEKDDEQESENKQLAEEESYNKETEEHLDSDQLKLENKQLEEETRLQGETVGNLHLEKPEKEPVIRKLDEIDKKSKLCFENDQPEAETRGLNEEVYFQREMEEFCLSEEKKETENLQLKETERLQKEKLCYETTYLDEEARTQKKSPEEIGLKKEVIKIDDDKNSQKEMGEVVLPREKDNDDEKILIKEAERFKHEIEEHISLEKGKESKKSTSDKGQVLKEEKEETRSLDEDKSKTEKRISDEDETDNMLCSEKDHQETKSKKMDKEKQLLMKSENVLPHEEGEKEVERKASDEKRLLQEKIQVQSKIEHVLEEKEELKKKLLDQKEQFQQGKNEALHPEEVKEPDIIKLDEKEKSKEKIEGKDKLQAVKIQTDKDMQLQKDRPYPEKDLQEAEKNNFDEEERLGKEKEEKSQVTNIEQLVAKSRLEEEEHLQNNKDVVEKMSEMRMQKETEYAVCTENDNNEVEYERPHEEGEIKRETEQTSDFEKDVQNVVIIRLDEEKREKEVKLCQEIVKQDKQLNDEAPILREGEDKFYIEKDEKEKQKKRFDGEQDLQRESEESHLDKEQLGEEQRLQKESEKNLDYEKYDLDAEKKPLQEEQILKQEDIEEICVKQELNESEKNKEDEERLEKETKEKLPRERQEEDSEQQWLDVQHKLKKESDERARLKQEQLDAEKKGLEEEEILKKESDEQICVEKELQEAEKNKLEKERRLQNKKEEKLRREREEKESEQLRLDEEQELKKESHERDSLKQEQLDAEKKRLDEQTLQKESDEKIRIELLEKAEKHNNEEEGRLQKEKEENLRQEREDQEAEQMRLEEELKKDNEEQISIEQELQKAEKHKKEEEEQVQKEKEDKLRREREEKESDQKRLDKENTKKKESEEKVRLEQERLDAEKKRLDEEQTLKKESDEKIRIEQELQKAEKLKKEEEGRLQNEKEEKLRQARENKEAEQMRLEEEKTLKKESEEKVRLEQERLDTEKKRLDEELTLKKESDDKIRIEQELQKAEEHRKEEQGRLQIEKEDKLRREREEKESEQKRLHEEETLKKESEEKVRLEQELLDTEKKRIDEEQTLKKESDENIRIEQELQNEEKQKKEEEGRLQKEKKEKLRQERENKEAEQMRLEEEKTLKKESEEKVRLEQERLDAEKKRLDEELTLIKESDEKIRIEQELQKTEKHRKEEEGRLQKEKEDKLRKEREEKESEQKRLDEEETLKKESEEKVSLEQERLDAEKKRLDEELTLKKENDEKIRIEQELQKAEKHKKEEEERLQKEKEDKLRREREEKESEQKRLDEEETLKKESEEKVRLEQERLDAEKKRLDEELTLKKESDEEIRIEQELQKAEKHKKEEKERLQKEKEDKFRREREEKESEQKRLHEEQTLKKESEEKIRLEQERLDAEKKRLDEEITLKKESDEKIHIEQELQKAEKHKKEEEERLQKEKEDKLRREREEKESEQKRLDKENTLKKETEEKVRLEQERLDAEKKRLAEEQTLKQENDERIRIEQELQKAEKLKKEEEGRLQNEKEEKLRQARENKEAEQMRLKEEKTLKKESEEKVRLEQERLDAEKKRLDEEQTLKKESDEKIRIEQELQKAEKRRKEEEERLRKEKEDKLRKEREEKESEQKRLHEEETLKKESEEKIRLEPERLDAKNKPLEEQILKSDKDEKIRFEKDYHEAGKRQKDEKTQTKIKIKKTLCHEEEEQNKIRDEGVNIKHTSHEEKPNLLNEKQETKENNYEDNYLKHKFGKGLDYDTQRDDKVCRSNGSMDKYKVGDIDISSSNDSKYDYKQKSRYISYNSNTNIDLESLRPPGYIEKKLFDIDRHVTDTLGVQATNIIPSAHKSQIQEYQYQSRMRSSTPQRYEVDQCPEIIEKHSDWRQRSKARSESRNSTAERRTGTPRDHKRKPVFSTYLTDRTAVEASRVKLTCSVLSSTDPTITWFKNGVLLNDKLKYRTKVLDGLITLEVLNAIPSDSAEYTCTVQNESGSISTSANLKVYPSFEASPIPPTFTRSIRDTYHLAENELVLESRIRGQPLPTITWLKDDKPVCDDERFQAYYLADGVCRLVINAPVKADSGKYTCKAENAMWSDQISHVVNFTGKESSLGPNLTTIDRSRFNRQVLESRRPHFTNVLTDYKVTRGGTIGLQVEIKGSPTRVEWLREGYAVTESHRNAQTFVEHGLYTLALSEVTEKESGLYTCRAWSSHGKVDMNAAITVVQPNELEGRPAIIVGRPEKDLLISVGEDLNISFRVQGEPKPKVIFMKGIRDITNSQRVCKMTSDDYIKFTVKRSVVSDAGTYCILARNAYGCDRAFVTVMIKQRASSENLISDWTYPTEDTALSIAERKYKSVPDRIPGEPSAVDGGSNWISLAWPKLEHQESAPVLAYKIESWLLGKEGGARWVELGITPLNSFEAFNLKQGEEYHFRVTPRNRYGWGEPVQTSSAIGIGLAGDRPEFTEILPGQLKVLVGETANLSCSFKGKPTPQIIWMKNGHELDDDDRRIKTLQNGCDCSLTIEDVQIEDEARYSCEASNVHGRVSTYARMAVITDRLVWEADAKLKRERSAGTEGEYPPQFTMRLRDRRVQATYPVRLTCQVIGNPPPLVTWFKDGHELCCDSRHTVCKDEHFHTLEIAPTTLEDGGVYEATARNSSGAVSCRCSVVVDKGIRAYIAPEFCCGLEPLYRLYEGEELRISAMVEAYPSVGVTWYRDGVRLRPSRRAIMTLDHDGQIELALASVTRRDAGVYTCTASNEVGQASTSGKVDVIGGEVEEEKTRTPPVVIIPDAPYSKEPMFTRKPRSSEAREGDTVIIECEVIGDPKPDVYWLRDFLKPDYYRDANHFKRVGGGPQYRFEIPHAKLDYTGTYSVVARNVHGEAKAIISLQILAKDIDASDEAHNIRYGQVDVIPRFEKELTDLLCYDGDAIEFECRVSGSPEPFIKWLHYNEVVRDNEDFETCFGEGTARLKIKQVTAEDEGTYTCEAFNNLGKAKSSACLVVYPPGEPNTLSQRLRRPPALRSAASTPRSTPRATPARSLSRTPGPDTRRLCSPNREVAPKFYTYPFNKVVEEGERVVFKCAVQGLPSPWTTWDKDGIVISPSARITIREKDEILRILEIEEVTIDDVGLYRITVENDYGRAEASARLEVITHKGKFYAGVRSCSPSPRRALHHRRRTPSTSRQD